MKSAKERALGTAVDARR